jgi:hypothetical protein
MWHTCLTNLCLCINSFLRDSFEVNASTHYEITFLNGMSLSYSREDINSSSPNEYDSDKLGEKSNYYPQCSYRTYFNIHKKLTLAHSVNIVPLLFNAIGSLLQKLPYTLSKEHVRLSSESCMHHFPTLRGPVWMQQLWINSNLRLTVH